eukprot:995673-Rhodomonas_salina.2
MAKLDQLMYDDEGGEAEREREKERGGEREGEENVLLIKQNMDTRSFPLPCVACYAMSGSDIVGFATFATRRGEGKHRRVARLEAAGCIRAMHSPCAVRC